MKGKNILNIFLSVLKFKTYLKNLFFLQLLLQINNRTNKEEYNLTYPLSFGSIFKIGSFFKISLGNNLIYISYSIFCNLKKSVFFVLNIM